jgi:KipI family sensor histidine kinase inhibitor
MRGWSVVGWSAVLLDCAGPGEAAAWAAALGSPPLAGHPLLAGAEIVPGAQTVLVDRVADPDAVARLLAATPAPPPLPADAGDLVELPVVYDGPDLARVAGHWGVPEAEVAAIHAGTGYRVAFVGFAPGFGYLTGLPAHRAVPRLDSPRTRVPAGSVGLAGAYTGVYPGESPGGWLLIGRTDAVLFDVRRRPPALLRPGCRVRFRPC